MKYKWKKKLEHECPATKLYKRVKKEFEEKWEKSELKDKFMGHLEKAEMLKFDTRCFIHSFAGKVSDSILKKLEGDKETQKELSRGVIKEISILFADIRGFTRRTENMPPEKIVTLLDLFVPEMLHIIMERHNGMVDKLLGDGIMALYGHPYQTEHDTIKALYSAIDMQQAASAMGAVLEMMGYEPIKIGVGINTGPVLLCELGNEKYRESTVIGSPVNVAAKMEDIALPDEIVIPEGSLKYIESHKPDIIPFFKKKSDKTYNIKACSFDWIKFLNGNPREFEDWEI